MKNFIKEKLPIIIVALLSISAIGFSIYTHFAVTGNSTEQQEQIEEVVQSQLPSPVYYVENGYAYAAISDKDIKKISKDVIEQIGTQEPITEEEKTILVEEITKETVISLEESHPVLQTDSIDMSEIMSEKDYAEIKADIKEDIVKYIKNNSSMNENSIITKEEVQAIVNSAVKNIDTSKLSTEEIETIVNEIVSKHIETKTDTVITESLLTNQYFTSQIQNMFEPLSIKDISVVQTNDGYTLTVGKEKVTLNHGVAGENGVDGKDGLNGQGITDISFQGKVNGENIYLVTYGDGQTTNFSIKDGEDGIDGKDGKDGTNGVDGQDGLGITNINHVSTENGINTFTISYGEDKETTFQLRDGIDGINGIDGKDGLGITNIELVSETETESHYEMTYGEDDKTIMFSVKHGKNGENGKDGIDGTDGDDGKSAYQSALDNGFVGTEEEWLNSLNGQDGSNGQDGIGITDISLISEEDGIATYQITYGKNAKTVNFAVNTGAGAGSSGVDGEDGEDGYTPIFGVDYFTDEQIDEISNDITNTIFNTIKPIFNATDFSTDKTYSKGEYVFYNNILYQANSDLDAGSFDENDWIAVNFLNRLDVIKNALNLVEYNPYSIYQVGDFVLYQDELYRCTEDITIAETWNPAKWERVSISEVLSDLDRKTAELDSALTSYKQTNDEAVSDLSADVTTSKSDILTLYSDYSDLLTTVSALSDIVDLNKENIDTLNNSVEDVNNTLSTHEETLKGIGVNAEAITNLSTSLETNYYSKLEIDELLANLPAGGTVDLTDYYTKDDIDTMVSELEETISTSGTGTTTIETVNSIDLSAVDVLLNASETPIVDANTYDLSDSIDNYAMIMVAVKTNITAEGDSDEVRTTLIPKAMYYPNINEGGKAFSLGTDTNYISWTFNSESPNTITVEDTANAGLVVVYGIKSDNVSNVEITANNSEKPNNNARGRASILPDVYSVNTVNSSYNSETHKLEFNIDDTSDTSYGVSGVYTNTSVALNNYEKITIDLESLNLEENCVVYVDFSKSEYNTSPVEAAFFNHDVYYICNDESQKHIEIDVPDYNDNCYIAIGLLGRPTKEYSSSDTQLTSHGSAVISDIQLHLKDGRIHSLIEKDETLVVNNKSDYYANGGEIATSTSTTFDLNKVLTVKDDLSKKTSRNTIATSDKLNFDNIKNITLDIANFTVSGDFSLLVSVTPEDIVNDSTDPIYLKYVIWDYSENIENSTITIDTSNIKGNNYLAVSLSSYVEGSGCSSTPTGNASIEFRGIYLTQEIPVDTKLHNIVTYGLEQLGYYEVDNSIITAISDSLEWDSSTISKSVDGSSYILTESEMNQLLTEMKKYSDADSDGNDDYGMWAYVGKDTLPANFEFNIWGNHTNTNLAEEQMANNVWWYYLDGMPWQYITTLKFNDEFVEPKDLIVIGLSTSQSQTVYKEETTLKSCDMSTARNTGSAWETNGGIAASLRLDNYYGDDLLAFNTGDDFVRWRNAGKPYKLKGTTYNTGDLTISKNIVNQTVNQSTNNNTTGSGSNSGSNDASDSYIPVEVDLSNYYTKTEIETLINDATKGDTSTIANSLGQATCKLLLDATDSPITAKGTYDLNDSIDNYDWLLVGGWAYNSGSNHEQWVTLLIPKEQFYVQPVGSELQFILNGSITSANRRIAFQFKEDAPDKINVTYKDGASLCRVYGIKNVAYDFQKLNQGILSDIGSLEVGNIQNASELIVVGSYEYTGSVPGYTGTHFSNGQTAKFSFSIPIAEILDGSDFSYSTYLYEDSGIHLLFNYSDGKLNYVTNKSTGLQNVKILSVYATGRSEGNGNNVNLTSGSGVAFNPILEYEGKLTVGNSITLETNFEDITALIIETNCDADTIQYENNLVLLNETTIANGVALTGFGKRHIDLQFSGTNTITAISASAETEATDKIPWVKSIYVIKKDSGSGSSSVDLSDYYNKTEIDALLGNTSTPDLSDYYSKTEIDDLLTSVREQITDTIPMPNAFGNMTCEVLLDVEDNPIIATGEHQLDKSIDDYDYLLVYGWAYVSGSTHEQRISLMIPKALYYKHGESSLDNYDWLLEGGHATETRRICFAFNENNPDKLYVGKREVAGISSIYGLKHVEQNTEVDMSNFYTKDEVNELIANQNNNSTGTNELVELSNTPAVVGEDINIGDIDTYSEIKIVGSFKYNGVVSDVTGEPTYAGQIVKYSFSVPTVDIIDGSDFIHSEWVFTNAGINLIFNYQDGILKLKSQQSIYYYDVNVLKVYGE